MTSVYFEIRAEVIFLFICALFGIIMNNATRFTNSWNMFKDDEELRALVLLEFAPIVSFMIESPKFPDIRMTAFTDDSAIIKNKKEFIITSTKMEFLEASMSIFRNNKTLAQEFFDECISIIGAKSGSNLSSLRRSTESG